MIEWTTEGPAITIKKVSGDNQIGDAGTVLPEPLGRVDEQEKKDYNIPPEPVYGGKKCQFDCC